MQTNIKEMITGSLLGDGYLRKDGRAKNAMFKFKQCEAHKQYVEYIYSKLHPQYVGCGVREHKARKPSRVNGKISHDIKYWNGEYCISNYFWTKAHEEFTAFYQEWYPQKKKIVPTTISLSPRALAHWYADDGHNHVNKKAQSKSLYLCTNAFSKEECSFLIEKLNATFGIKAGMSGKTIRVAACSYFDFIDIVAPYVKEFGCFDYKVDISDAPSDMKGGWPGFKVTPEIAAAIRREHSTGSKQIELVNKYNVSKSTISRIIKGRSHKVDTLKLGGTATVKLGFNYAN